MLLHSDEVLVEIWNAIRRIVSMRKFEITVGNKQGVALVEIYSTMASKENENICWD